MNVGMDIVAVESTGGANSLNFGLLIGGNYEVMLKESIDRFLDDFGKGISDFFPDFGSIFYRFLQARVDPPLEVIWFYSAISFRSGSSLGFEPSNRVSMAKDLFQLLAACAASCVGLKSVALLAPVLFELYWAVVDLQEKKLSPKSEKKLMRAIEHLMEGIFNYISVCCSTDFAEEDASVSLLLCLTDLVRIWMFDRLEGNREVEDDVKMFFPLISDDIRQGLDGRGCAVGDLAGIVIAQAFLLRLCLKFRKFSGLELQKELRTSAVGAITGFRNFYFFETLVRMLLEPTLPVISLLAPEDEILLKKALYDAVILADYSFLNNIERGISSHGGRVKRLAVIMLALTHEASEFFRKHGDRNKAISYINAFTGSNLSSQLVKWITTQFGMEEEASRPNVSTPKVLIRWLINLEEQGVRVFDDDLSKLRAKLILELQESDHELPTVELENGNQENDLFFYIDNKGEEEDGNETDQEMIESTNAALLSVARSMKSTAGDRRRKRKGVRSREESQVKFVKYHLNNDSEREEVPLCSDSDDDGLGIRSGVENPESDEDVVKMDS